MKIDQPMLFDQIEKEAKRIYAERFRAKYEATHAGEFLAIDVTTGSGYHGKYTEDALGKAHKAAPDGVIFLIRIGADAAFRVGYLPRGIPG